MSKPFDRRKKAPIRSIPKDFVSLNIKVTSAQLDHITTYLDMIGVRYNLKCEVTEQ